MANNTTPSSQSHGNMTKTVLQKLAESRDYILSKTKLRPQIGIVLGSGLGSFAEKLEVESIIPFAEIPNYYAPTVAGHGGKLFFGTLSGRPLLVQQGRVHYYEGHSMQEVAHPVRTMGLLGVKKLILTNAAGGLKRDFRPGDLMTIRDHINLMGNNPLLGPNTAELGPRFPDMTQTYTPALREKLKHCYEKLGLRFHDGVYCGLTGPTYETPAEIEYLRRCGVDAVGMSTVPEAIAARHMGLEIAGISCITNMAAGMSGEELSHEEVTETGKKVEKDFVALLTHFIESL